MLPRPTASAGFGMAFADQLCDVRLLSNAMGWAAAASGGTANHLTRVDRPIGL